MPIPLFLAFDAPAKALGGGDGPDLTRYLIVCALLLLAIGALAWGFRRLVGRTLRARAAQRSLRVLDVLPMGGKQKLAVVRCYDRTFLLGLGERELSLVAELDPALAPAREANPSAADRRSFADLLSRVRIGAGRKSDSAAPADTARDEAHASLPNQGVLG